MSNATLVLLIIAAILAQVAAIGLFNWQRQRIRFQSLQRQGVGDPGAPAGVGVLSADPLPVTVADPSSAWSGYREFVVQRRVIEDRSGAVCSFYLVPADGQPLPTYRPGQYLTFRLEVAHPAGSPPKTLVRCYSLSDRPRSDRYRVTIKRCPSPPGRPDLPPGVASNHLHDHLAEGSRVWVKAPAGRFYVTDDGSLPIVLIGGGIGITPLLSILSTLSQRADPRPVWLFYGVRNGAEHVLRESLQTLIEGLPGSHLHICYSQPGPDDCLGRDYQHQGHVDLPLLQRTLGFGRYEFYVCGPKAMMESLVPALAGQGVLPTDLHYESFGPASLRPRPAAVPAAALAVRFSRSGKTAPWDGSAASLLELAEGQGIAVESGCRAGSCGTCETRIESGEITYSQDPEVELKPNHCLLCIATPTTAVTLAV
jgi:hypothetical protein